VPDVFDTGRRLTVAMRSSPAFEGPRRLALRGSRLTHGLPRAFVPMREELPLLLNRRGLVGCAVEIGVKRGEFSELLLRRWQGRHLISVDPWRAAEPDDYVDVANVSQEQHDAFHAETVERLAPFGERSTIWRDFGSDAAARIPHHCLDFVYLDARHDRESVAEDLADWYPKVRPGGILAGHDYVDGLFAEGEFGVRSAVDEFAARHGVVVSSTLDPPWPSWWMVIPRS
jgi:Methyltransferase domain